LVPFSSCWDAHKSANAALKAIAEVQASTDRTKTNNASSFNKKSSSTFQLVVASVNWISKAILEHGRNSNESSCASLLAAHEMCDPSQNENKCIIKVNASTNMKQLQEDTLKANSAQIIVVSFDHKPAFQLIVG
jgi:hypothetical protein